MRDLSPGSCATAGRTLRPTLLTPFIALLLSKALLSISFLEPRFWNPCIHCSAQMDPTVPAADNSNANPTMLPIRTRNANPRAASMDTSNAIVTATPFDTNDANPQTESPLFGRIPGEIRDHIFDLALTAYSGKQEPFEKNAYYYRPGFRYADQKIDIALLCTCRQIYREACQVPAQNYESVEWHQPGRGLPAPLARRFARAGANFPCLNSLHLFTQQFWLEDSSWRNAARNIAQRRHPNLRQLRITIRHSDWWWWETSAPLVLDAKRKGKQGQPSAMGHSTASDGFHVQSWGQQFSYFKRLKTFELELETVEGKCKELDEIVIRAADWRFPLGDGNVLVLNPTRTRRTGWHGLKLPIYCKCILATESPTRKIDRFDADEANSRRNACPQRPQGSQGEACEERCGL